MRRRERVFAVLAIIGSLIGAAGLILLSIFDTKRHSTLHRLFLLIFIVGVGLSAIFSVIEVLYSHPNLGHTLTFYQYRWLSKDFYDTPRLRKAYIMKGIIAGLLILLAIGFGIALYFAVNVGGVYSRSCPRHPLTHLSAVFEWVIAYGFTLYLLTFFYDLRMSKNKHKGELSRERLTAMGQARI